MHRSRPGTGTWPWLLQRVTAVLIFIFLGAHLWVLHFAELGKEINFERVTERLQSPWFIFLDLTLLALVIYHALYGIRAIIIDFGIGVRAQSVLFWAFIIIGVAGFVLGANALLPLIIGKPWF